MEKVEFGIAVERQGVDPIGELCRCVSVDAAAAIVRALLDANDRRIIIVTVSIVRLS